MRFGLTLPHYGFSLPTGRVAFADAAEWARRAEALGFDSVWVSDHFFYSFARYGADPSPMASLEPLTMLAGIAAVTDRVRLGTLVLCAAFRHPAVLAKATTSIDLLSGGRLDLGLGAGWMAEEFEAFGYRYGPVGERFTILEETFDVLKRLFSGESVTYDGPNVTLREAVLRPTPDRPPPLWVGGKGGPRLLRLAARLADGWNVVWRMSPDAYAGKVADVRAACEAAGRDPATFGLSVGLYSLIGEDEAAARAAFERGRAAAPGNAMAEEDHETWRADTLSGTPEQVLERVAAFESLGVGEIIVAPWVLPFAIHEPDQVELFAERVIAARRGS
ncbi:MAG TPA: LLM class flavin-dependent oxidoreductase [Actinomycetota bacterium]|nr:LLM class flavin-dependent oxidoreductase [Actinomycetota bacterium]